MLLRPLLLLLLLPLALGAKTTAPAWLAQAAAQPVPSYDKKIKAVRVLREVTYDIRSDGTITTTERVALRMVQPEGYSHAKAITHFTADTDKVRTSLAWLVPPTGDVVPYVKKDFLEIGATDDSLYSDSRLLSVSASGNAVTGSTFGYEFVIESRSSFSQLFEILQDNLPTLRQTITVKLPKDWNIKPTFFNHPPVTPRTQGLVTTWQFELLPAIIDEPRMPSARKLTAALGLDLLLPPNARTKEKLFPYFATWKDLSLYQTQIYDPLCAAEATITAKAQELTKNATTTLEILQALGRHAQKINYASISMNLGRGGGFKPHPASLILQRNFGDCKDKATLLRALLSVKGIKSYPVIIFSGDNQAVAPEWPSPNQFNHAIIAISVPPEIQSPAILDHPTLGRLLIFDPTDPDTPLLDLPGTHYGSQVLLIAGADGGLVTLPDFPAERATLNREITATLGANGQLTAHLTEHAFGPFAAEEREDLREKPTAEYQKYITNWINGSIRGAKITDLKTVDAFDQNQFTIQLDLAAPTYAQSLRGKLLIFKPTLVNRRRFTGFTEEKRTHPILFRPFLHQETTTINLPAGYTVDELPKPVDLKTSFARYQASCRAENGVLTQTRSLKVEPTEIPASDYAAVKLFFEQVIKAEQATAVLQRAPAAPAQTPAPAAAPAPATPAAP